jgi:heme A synthase
LEVAVSYRRRTDPFPRTIGVLLVLYVVIQLGIGVALLLQGMRLEAAIVILLGPLVGVLVADAVLVYLRVARSLHSVREAFRLGRLQRRRERPTAPLPNA